MLDKFLKITSQDVDSDLFSTYSMNHLPLADFHDLSNIALVSKDGFSGKQVPTHTISTCKELLYIWLVGLNQWKILPESLATDKVFFEFG